MGPRCWTFRLSPEALRLPRHRACMALSEGGVYVCVCVNVPVGRAEKVCRRSVCVCVGECVNWEGKSVRVYQLKSGYKKLKGVPEEKNYTPTPAPENGPDQLPGLYGKVVEVDTVNHRLKVRMWFHADGVFPITPGAHSKAKVVPFKRTDGGPSTLTFIHLVKWLDPSQVHRVGAGPLMKFVKGVLLGAEVAKEEYEAAEGGMEDLAMCSTTDEDEELNLGAEAGEQSDPEDPSGEEEEEDEEETEED